MKLKRTKHVRKTLLFYKNNFGVQAPYHVLIDGTFCKAALKYKINISEQLPKYLDAEVRLQTTPCVIAECEYFGKMLYGPLKVLQQFKVKPCAHETPQAPLQCLRRMVKGKKCSEKFFIATQDALLSEKVRKLAGVPLLYISHNAIILEAPSDASKSAADSHVKGALLPTTSEQTNLAALKKIVFGEESSQGKKKRRRKIKGPNPLSCKKKKKENAGVGKGKSETVEKKSRSRHKRKSEKQTVET